MNDKIIIKGAKEHNLKNINLEIPRDKLVVITGLSGSGKSSLAFDTLYAEGQRRYVESLSSYARQFLGLMEKPDVESIEGLSPAISIDQKTTSRNPRSTVGTVTEIYDYIRLLYARVGTPYCPICGKKIEKQSIDQIVDNVMKLEQGTRIQVLAPVVRSRKGEYTKLFEDLQKEGFARVRVDGEIYDLADLEEIKLDKNKKHEIEIVVDRLVIKEEILGRLTESIEVALKHADNLVLIDVIEDKTILYSCNYACPDCGFSFPELSPRMFSFNNPYGACPKCSGIGYLMKMDEDLIIPDKDKTLYDGVKAFGSSTMKKGDTMARMYFESIGKHYGVDIKNKKIKDLPRKFLEKILYGTGNEEIDFEFSSYAGVRKFTTPFEGVLPTLERRHNETKSQGMRDFYELYMSELPCDECHGARLKKEILCIKIGGKNINEVTDMSIRQLQEFLRNVELTASQKIIADMILKEIDSRLQFLIDVGLEYLTLSRSAGTLSGGEAQRIRLATQIGSGLTGVLYILDEPSIGLHQRDNDKLIATLKKLRDLGNTLFVVEHDEDTMYAADQIIDIGPGAGVHGGQVMAQGTAEEIKNIPNSITGDYLSGRKQIHVPSTRRKGNKKCIEDHFDKSVELEMELEKAGKQEMLDMVRRISDMVDIHYIRQKEPRGLGHAIHCAKSFVGNEPFAVMLGDDVVDSEVPCLKQLIDCFNEYKTTILGVQTVDPKNVDKYGIVDGLHIEDRVYKVKRLVEKPSVDEAPSNVAILGRYIITPQIFEILENTAPGKGNEIQLTDALETLIKNEAMYAYDFEGRRYDVGDKLGFLQATVEFALKREELREPFIQYLNTKPWENETK